MDKNPASLPPHFRWNFFAFLVDYICFGVAFSFASITTVMPALATQLTDSAPLIGLVGTVFNGCWLLPQLAVARLINDKPRKKPYMIVGMSGRIMLGVIALALWAGLARQPMRMLVLYYACLGLFTTTDGVASVAWFDILARAIPLKQRGRLIGLGQVISGLVGTGAGVLVGLILNQRPFPANYALIFALAGAVLVPSALAMASVHEPPPEDPDPRTRGQATDGWWSLLATDRAFRGLTACRLLVGMMGLASSFYVAHAADVLHLPHSIIGGFVVAQTLAGVVASVIMGLVSERWGSRYVTRIGAVAAALGPLFAIVAHLAGEGWLVQAYPFVYVTLGVVNSAWMLGFFNYLLEIAPDGMRPAYIGLSNTLMGILTLAPMAGGWLLEATSYPTLFGVTTALTGAGFLFTLRLAPPQPATPAENTP